MKVLTNVRNFPMRSWWKDHSTGKIYYVVGIAFDTAGNPDVRELHEVGVVYDPFKPQLKHITDLCELFQAGQLTEYVNKP